MPTIISSNQRSVSPRPSSQPSTSIVTVQEGSASLDTPQSTNARTSPITVQMRLPVLPRRRRSSRSYPSISELFGEEPTSLNNTALSSVDWHMVGSGEEEDLSGLICSTSRNQCFVSVHPHDCPFYQSY